MSDEERSYLLPLRPGADGTMDLVKLSRDRSIHVLGETGSGKTEAIKLLAAQFPLDRDTPVVVFDYKDDYARFFELIGRGDDLVRLSISGSDATWNVFDEATTDEEFEEIGRLLFKGDEEASSNPFFPQAARQVFVALLEQFATAESVTNFNFWEILRTMGDEEADARTATYRLLRDGGHAAAAAHVNPEAPKQSSGVFSHLQLKLTELFTGDFRGRGEFSVREYMHAPDGRILVLDYPIDRGETVKPVYRFFIDWAIRYALQNRETKAYFILDEFQTIPGLEKVERLVNVGRARNAYAVLGLQSVSQLESTYGEQAARSILSGLPQEVLLRPGDGRTTDYVRTRVGRTLEEREVAEPTETIQREHSGETGRRPETTTISEQEYQLSEAELQQFRAGDAVVIQQDDWHRGRLYRLEDVSATPDLEKVRAILADQGLVSRRTHRVVREQLVRRGVLTPEQKERIEAAIRSQREG